MVQFSLGGQVAVSPGMVSTPGSINGMATVVLTGVDSLGAITDPSASALLNFSLQASFPGGPLQFNQLTPGAGGTLVAGASSDLLGPVAGATFGIAPNGVVFQLFNGLVGPINFTNQMAIAVQLASLGVSGASQLMFNGSIGSSGPTGVTAQFSLLGSEVARTFAAAPEPAESGLLAAGLALFAAGAWLFRATRVTSVAL